MADGLTATRAEAAGRLRLLAVLGDLNDVEVLILTSLGQSKPERDAFWRQHRAALEHPLPTWFSQPEAAEQAALYRNYYVHLQRVDLIREEGRALTDFGRYFLRAAGALGRGVADIDQAYEMDQRRTAGRFVPEYWAALKPELADALRRLSTRLEPPRELEIREAPGLSFVGTLGTNAAEPPSVQIFASPVDMYVWSQYVWKSTSPAPLTPQRELGAPRRLDLRRDSEGVYALVAVERVYSVRNAAEYLCEPLAQFVSSQPASIIDSG